MLVGSKIVEHDNVSINLDRISLPQVTEQKILGVLIDSKLNRKPHIETLERSLSSKLGLLHRVSYFLPVSKLHLIYNAIIQSRFDYGITKLPWVVAAKPISALCNVCRIVVLELSKKF